MEQKFVINIGRQLGSGGKQVGTLLAQRLGVKCYDKELIGLAAEESGIATELFEQVDERESKPLLSTLLGYLRSPSMEEGGRVNPLSAESLFQIQSDVIRRLAERESCIFVGRCADYILRDHPRCINIFLTASEEARIARICQREVCCEERARERMWRGDKCRADYYNYYTTRSWGMASSYDLCINTSKLGVEATVELILDFVKRTLQTE